MICLYDIYEKYFRNGYKTKYIFQSFSILALILSPNAAVSNPVGNNKGQQRCSTLFDILGPIYSRIDLKTDFIASDSPKKPIDKNLEPDGSVSQSPISITSDVWKAGWLGDSPSPELVKLWVRSPVRALPDCVTKKYASFHGPKIDAKNIPNGDPFIWRISAPVFSHTSNSAIVLISKLSKSVGGQSKLWLLKKRGMHWTAVGSRILRIE